jgi:hypothetical protein
MNRPLLLSALLFALTSAACGSPDPGGDAWGGRTDVEAIFENDCGSCHASTWSSCWTSHDSATTLTEVIQSGAMPLSGPMAPADKAAVLSWLQGGAACVGTDPNGDVGGPPVSGSGAATP